MIKMRVNGKIDKIEILDDQVRYNIQSADKEYNVRSVNRQAIIKDAIFLREGQTILVNGVSENDVLLVNEAKIDIRRIGEK